MDRLVNLLEKTTITRKRRTRKPNTRKRVTKTAKTTTTRKNIRGGMFRYRTFVQRNIGWITLVRLVAAIGSSLDIYTLEGLHPYDFRIFYYDPNGTPHRIETTGPYLTFGENTTHKILPITIDYKMANQNR